MDALKQYRTGGEQRVTVEHVTVNEVGKAIVGNVTHSGGVHPKNQKQPHEPGLSVAAKPTVLRDGQNNRSDRVWLPP